MAGGSFGAVVGAGLIGGAVGYLGGSAIGDKYGGHDGNFVVAAALVSVAGAAQAQPTNFDQAAYITCKEAHAMKPEARKALAVYLADHSARYRGVVIPDARSARRSAIWCAAAARWRPTPTSSR